MYRKLQVSGLSEIISFTCISAIWDEHPASWFLTSPCPLFLSAHCGGARGISQLLHRRQCSPFSGGGGGGEPPGSEIHIWRPEISDDCDILLYWHGRSYSISQILAWLTLSNIAFSMRPTLTLYLELQLYLHTCILLMFLYFIALVTHTIFLFIIFILSVFHWECSSTEIGILVCLNHWCTYAK